MEKLFLLFIALVSVDGYSQIYYHQSPGATTVTAGSLLLPVTNITPTIVTSNNPGSIPIKYSTPYSDQLNFIYQYVDRTQVSSGLLMDYGTLLTNVEKYAGARSDSNYLVFAEWQSLYTSLFSFRFNSNLSNTAMPHPVEVANRAESYGIQQNGGSNTIDRIVFSSANNTVHLLSGLHYQYHKYRSDALSANLVYISNGQIFDTPGRPASPYEVKESFAIAPRHPVLSGSGHSFLLKPDLFFTNTGKTISALQADFADGLGQRTINFNTASQVYYSTEGDKVFVFKVTYTDGTNYESHAKVKITNIPPTPANPAARYSGSNIDIMRFPRNDFAAPQAFLGQTAAALVTIEFGTNTLRQIRKPLIIVEGFDPWNIIAPDDPRQNMSFRGFVDVDINKILPNGQNLSDLLDDNDYDLIYVDFADGTDHIQRNAFLVENIIEFINSVKQPFNGVRQQNIVVGFSMGALISRFALRHLETRGIVHETKLNVSFDGPHQGANIPVGFQAIALHVAGIQLGFGVPLPGIYYTTSLGALVPEIGRAASLLNRPAARQMLTYKVAPSIFGGFDGYDNSAHDTFMSEYTAMGLPTQNSIRNIAIANGAECGLNQGYAPYAEYLNYNLSLKLPYLANFFLSMLGPWTNYPQLTFGLLSTKSQFNAEFKINALPDKQVQQIYKGKVSIKQKILGVLNVNIVLTDLSLSSNNSQLPLDNSGGGTYDINRIVTQLPFAINFTRFNFVPTFSSLDIGRGTQIITTPDLAKVYTPASFPPAPKDTPFSNFFTNPANNELHIQITPINGRWLFDEIQGVPAFFSCSFFCSGSTSAFITGANTVCSTNTTYTLNNVPALTGREVLT